MTAPARQTSLENASVSLQLVASDPDGNPLTYSATGLPPSLAVSSTTGLISGTLSFASAGTYSVTATVSDGLLSGSRSIQLDRDEREPSADARAARESVAVRRTPVVSLQLAGTDPDGTALTYGATDLPAGASLNASTGLVSGTLSHVLELRHLRGRPDGLATAALTDTRHLHLDGHQRQPRAGA